MWTNPEIEQAFAGAPHRSVTFHADGRRTYRAYLDGRTLNVETRDGRWLHVFVAEVRPQKGYFEA